MTCGAEGWAEAMYFCPTDGMWVCRACAVRFGLADPTPRCPRCYAALLPNAGLQPARAGVGSEVEG
jgi:hypothetical protein